MATYRHFTFFPLTALCLILLSSSAHAQRNYTAPAYRPPPPPPAPRVVPQTNRSSSGYDSRPGYGSGQSNSNLGGYKAGSIGKSAPVSTARPAFGAPSGPDKRAMGNVTRSSEPQRKEAGAPRFGNGKTTSPATAASQSPTRIGAGTKLFGAGGTATANGTSPRGIGGRTNGDVAKAFANATSGTAKISNNRAAKTTPACPPGDKSLRCQFKCAADPESCKHDKKDDKPSPELDPPWKFKP